MRCYGVIVFWLCHRRKHGNAITRYSLLSMRYAFLVIGILFMTTGSAVQAQDEALPHPDWAGTWRGALINVPARADAQPVDVVH